MASTSVLSQSNSSSISALHADPDIVAQAFAFHRMLAPSHPDGYQDEFDDEYELISNSDEIKSVSNSPRRDEEQGPVSAANITPALSNPVDGNTFFSLSKSPIKKEDHDSVSIANTEEVPSNPKEINGPSNLPTKVEAQGQSSNANTEPVFAIKLHDRLLWPAPSSRSIHKKRIECTNAAPRSGLWVTEPELGLSDLDIGLLSQLAQICVHANIKYCLREECNEKRTAMEKSAPQCDWNAFREWALTTMSCQAAMTNDQKESRAHAHIATAISCLCKIFKECRRLRPALRSTRFRPHLDGDLPTRASIDLAQVSNLTFWMIKIQLQIGVGPTDIGRWNHHFLPKEVTLPRIEHAVHVMEDLELCKNRLWNLVSVSDRKQSDLPDIVSALKLSGRALDQKEHEFCTPSKCQWAHLNSTMVTQLHKCIKGKKTAPSCTQKEFPVELLETALEMNNSTAWLREGAKLSGSQDPYIAISHVWSDGTGVGLKDAGTVNSCLFDFFANIAERLDCKALWWDALSIPSEPKARSKALNMMHSNYANARHTVVHDKALLEFPWSNDGSPCLALVLSTWFTRGWTALELSMSKSVKVLFKNPEDERKPLLKDLDEDILAQSPGSTSRAHWLATTLVKKLRRPVRDVGDLLAILSARSTSWVRDRTIIAALLAGVPDCDFTLGESQITIKVLQYLGKIPYFCLLHGKPTMRSKGPFSWCAATLDDMPVDTSFDVGGNKLGDLLAIDESGAVDGQWYCHIIPNGSSAKKLKAYGNDLAAVVKVNVALSHWDTCLLLHPSADRHDPLSLLVMPITINKDDGVLECRYIGTVVEDHDGEVSEPENPVLLKIRMGAEESESSIGMEAKDAIGMMAGKTTSASNDPKRRDQHADDQQGKPSPDDPDHPDQPNQPKWLEKAKSLGEHDGSLGCSTKEQVPQLDTDGLFTAIQTRRKTAALYLVKRGVSMGTMDVLEMFKRFGSSEQACASMKMLGDVYAKVGKFEHAVSLYQFVGNKYRDVQNTNPLQPLYCDYELANTFARAARELSDSEFQARLRMQAAALVKDAKDIFDDILKVCDQRARLRGETESSQRIMLERRKTWDDASRLHEERGEFYRNLLKRSNSAANLEDSSSSSAGQSHSAKTRSEEAVEKSEWPRDAQRWYRLELNVIADLTLMLTGNEDFDGAGRTFRKAFRRFSSLPEDVEGFNLQLAERDGLDFEGKAKRDEQAVNVYQRALKRFDHMFQGDHLLIFFTSLHLGVNYLLTSKFSLAEKNLTRALNGFVSRLSPVSAENQFSARSDKSRTNEHIVIGLARYWLGVLFRNQNKLDEAKRQLEEARKIASRFYGSEGKTLKLSATLELGMIFAQRLRSEQTTKDLVSGAESHFEDVSNHTERWLTKHELRDDQPRSLQAMRHLYFRSSGNLVLLRLHHGKLEDGALHKLKTNLDQYGGDRCGAGTKKNDREVSNVAECEARRILGQAYMQQKEFHSAEPELRTAWDGYLHWYGRSHLETLDVCVMYADTLIKRLELEEAPSEDPEKLLEESVKTYGQTAGSYHPRTLEACLKLGQAYLHRHKLEKAEKIFERAFHGFGKTGGSGHLMTARAARLLGDVYFERGTVGKAKDMYEKAYMAFSDMSISEPTSADSQITDDLDVSSVTKIETLQATMDFAKVCALIPTTTMRQKAIDLYGDAIKGFSALKGYPLAVTGGLVARMRLGALYGATRNFRKGEDLIKAALSELKGLNTAPDGSFRTMQRSMKESLLEAELELVYLKLNEHKREKKHTSDFEPGMVTNQNIHEGLITTLREIFQIEATPPDQQNRSSDMAGIVAQSVSLHSGRILMLTLEAHTALGELILDSYCGCIREHDLAQGEQILVEVLKTYGPHGKAELAIGHPKRVHIMDRLIAHYERMGQEDKVNELNLQLFGELESGYGIDHAVLMIDATSGSKHAARCASYDDRLRENRRKSGSVSETSSLRTGSVNHNRNSVDEGVLANESMSGALPRASSPTADSSLDRSNNSQGDSRISQPVFQVEPVASERNMDPRISRPVFQVQPVASERNMDSRISQPAFQGPPMAPERGMDPRISQPAFQGQPMAPERGMDPRISQPVFQGRPMAPVREMDPKMSEPVFQGHPVASQPDLRNPGPLPKAPMSNSGVSIPANYPAPKMPGVKRIYDESMADPAASPNAPGSLYDDHYDGS